MVVMNNLIFQISWIIVQKMHVLGIYCISDYDSELNNNAVEKTRKWCFVLVDNIKQCNTVGHVAMKIKE